MSSTHVAMVGSSELTGMPIAAFPTEEAAESFHDFTARIDAALDALDKKQLAGPTKIDRWNDLAAA